MVVEDKQTSHDSTSLCQKTWESSVSAHGPRQWINEPPETACITLVVDRRTEERSVFVATGINMPRQRPNC